jgi:hypothetical protein
MKARDFAAMLYRAAACIDDPASLNAEEKLHLVQDLTYEAEGALLSHSSPLSVACTNCGAPLPAHHVGCKDSKEQYPASGIKTRGMTADIPPRRK